MDYTGIHEIVFAIEEKIATTLTPKRFAHCKSTAQTASKLAQRFDGNVEMCYLAGLAHDMCRELSFEEQQNIVHQNSKCLSFISQRDSYKAIFADEYFTKKMLHGPAAACMLYSSYNIFQFDILEAVALHSIADETMSQCAKIVFISDKLEPLREQRHDAQKNLNTLPLNDLFIYTIACVKSWFSESGKPILPYTSVIYSRILNK